MIGLDKMKRMSILDDVPDLPLQFGPSAEIIKDVTAALPAGVLRFYQEAPALHLLAWNDDSATMGLYRQGRLITFEQARLLGLTISVLLPAKGTGWLSLEAVLRGQEAPLALLESTYSKAGMAWLEARLATFEAVFGVKPKFMAYGYDC